MNNNKFSDLERIATVLKINKDDYDINLCLLI